MNETIGLGAIGNLDYTVLLCDDLAVMRSFYRDVMGFAESPNDISDSWIEFRIGGTTLALSPRGRRPFDGPAPEDAAIG